jgi:hypothetical protein
MNRKRRREGKRAKPETASPETVLRIGSTEVSAALLSANVSRSLRMQSGGTVALDITKMAESPDLSSEFTLSGRVQGEEVRVFTGHVTSAQARGPRVELAVHAGAQLGDTTLRRTVFRGLESIEKIYFILREGGYGPEKMQLDGLEDLPERVFEITIPVSGVSVEQTTVHGRVALVTASVAREKLTPYLGGDNETTTSVAEQFGAYDSFATVVVRSRLAHDAELMARRTASVLVAALATDSRYSRLVDNAGRFVRFDRSRSIGAPALADMALLNDLKSQTGWLRETGSTPAALPIDLALYPRAGVNLHSLETPAEEEALLALLRAASGDNPLTAVQDLWTAIEFMISGYRVEKRFSDSELDTIRSTVSSLTELSDAQHQRVKEVIGRLNDESLNFRLRQLVAELRIGVTPDELKHLARLRALRNSAVHGHAYRPPEPEDLHRGVSIVAFMIVEATRSRRSLTTPNGP